MSSFFLFNHTATTDIYTLSLHDALPIWFQYRARGTTSGLHSLGAIVFCAPDSKFRDRYGTSTKYNRAETRSEEHTSELQSLTNLVCRLLLEKKKKKRKKNNTQQQQP